MKAWIPFGKTGYSFGLGMKPEAGRKIAETGSAVQRDTIPMGGKGSDRSKAVAWQDFKYNDMTVEGTNHT